MSRWHGVKDLVQDAVEGGANAVEKVHTAVASKPFDVLEQVTPIALPVKGVRLLHDTIVSGVYASIRLVNKAVGVVATVAIDAATGPKDDAGPGSANE